HVHSSEERVISQMASYLGISSRDYQSIKAMFYKNDAASAYKILEIDKNVTEAELKKAHRKMVKKYHPDRLKGLGETQMKAGESKFIEVQKAYENIKKEKGWN
ncbi:MAG: DnaJ like chaperone protein, partial [Saprospiraceae bacterium]